MNRQIERHFELLELIEESYHRRAESEESRRTCEHVAVQHIAELPDILGPLRRSCFGQLPRIPTFQYLATLFTEEGRFDEAIQVCKLALSYDLHDNTVGGFEARITRIRKKQTDAAHQLPRL